MRIPLTNMLAGWMGVLAGVLTGAVIEIFAERPRPLVRLAHVSCLGLGLLNVLFALAFDLLKLDDAHARIAAWGLIVALATMPLCCLLAAWRRSMGLLLPFPLAAAVAGVAAILMGHQ